MLHLIKYQFMELIRGKEVMFWALFFPIILATLFSLTLTNMSDAESFKVIDVALVESEQHSNSSFSEFIHSLDGKYVTVDLMSEEKSLVLLEEGKVKGVFYDTQVPSLSIQTNGVEQSILSSLLYSYITNEAMILQVMNEHPQQLQSLLESLQQSDSTIREVNMNNELADTSLSYFFSLIAMASLYGGFLGLQKAMLIQANLSSLAARICVAPMRRFPLVIISISSAITVQCTSLLLLLGYIHFILGISLGSNWIHILLTSFIGCILGVCIGYLIGALRITRNMTHNTKTNLVAGCTMLMCFFSGLMSFEMRYLIQQQIPLLNRINPAALIADSLESIVIFNNEQMYYENLVIMIGMSILFISISILITRRQKYDNI